MKISVSQGIVINGYLHVKISSIKFHLKVLDNFWFLFRLSLYICNFVGNHVFYHAINFECLHEFSNTENFIKA